MTAVIGVTAQHLPGREPWSPLFQGQTIPYTEALIAAGGTPMILPLTEDEDALRRLYDGTAGLLLAGGADIQPSLYGQEPYPTAERPAPIRDDAESAWLRWALADAKPVLAICRGMQLLNVVAGGTLYQDIPTDLPGSSDHRGSNAARDYAHLAHVLSVAENSDLARTLGTARIRANASHHQAVRELAPGYRAVAWAEDGVIEAIEPTTAAGFLLAVQAHPESLVPDVEPAWQRLFQAFVQAVKEYDDHGVAVLTTAP